ncbi:hypothetical protein [Melittangium boletus]|uniref:hypothetical protein n=1 Tax=Melittangium boletus TaxID=83453 RepID=UPI003DA63714
MQLVLRPVNDRFFHEQVLPFLSLCMSDSAKALRSLLGQLVDETSRELGERLLSSHIGGGLGGMEHAPWTALMERLTGQHWAQEASGWRVVGERPGYVGDWDEALHLALMLEDPTYPYAHARAAHGRREGFRRHPVADLGLASLIGGQWDPFPAFPPDRVFSPMGHGGYVPREQYAFADWAWRPAATVSRWHAELESKLLRLLERERERLSPAQPPELDAVRDYFLGRTAEAPALPEALVGPRGFSWVHRIGWMAALLRDAVREEAGLMARMTPALNAQVPPSEGSPPAG